MVKTKLLFGTHRNKIDEKRRVALPSSFRDAIGNEAYITKDFEGTITIRSKKEFEKYAEQLKDLDVFSVKTRELQRKVFGRTYEITFDSQGRFVLSKELYSDDLKNKNNEIIFMGLGDKIEIHKEVNND